MANDTILFPEFSLTPNLQGNYDMKRVATFGLAFLILSGLSIGVIWLLRPNIGYQERIELSKNLSSPLPSSTIENLCQKMNLSRTNSLCNNSMEVYSVDFYDEIESYLRPTPEKQVAFSSVEELLGQYAWGECSLNNDGSQRCYYDIRGDQIFIITVIFNEDKSMEKLLLPKIAEKYDRP